MAADCYGNVYTVGYVQGVLPGKSTSFVRRYDTQGAEVWFGEFGGLVHWRLALDRTGNVYVASGASYIPPGQSSPSGPMVLVSKYDPKAADEQTDSAEVWTRQLGAGASARATSIAVDEGGNVLVAGEASPLPGQGSSGIFLRKYDPHGDELWTRQFGPVPRGGGSRVAADASGNVFLFGLTGGTVRGQTSPGREVSISLFLRKYGPLGEELWTRQFGGPRNVSPGGLAVDQDGNAYVAGVGGPLRGQSSRGIFIRRYGPDGNEVWTRQFSSDPPGREGADDVAVDRKGNVYLAGQLGVLHGQAVGAFVRKYSPWGTELWTRLPGPSAHGAHRVATDYEGNVYVAGDRYVTKLRVE